MHSSQLVWCFYSKGRKGKEGKRWEKKAAKIQWLVWCKESKKESLSIFSLKFLQLWRKENWKDHTIFFPPLPFLSYAIQYTSFQSQAWKSLFILFLFLSSPSNSFPPNKLYIFLETSNDSFAIFLTIREKTSYGKEGSYWPITYNSIQPTLN